MSEPDDAPLDWQFYVEDMIGFRELGRDYGAQLLAARGPASRS